MRERDEIGSATAKQSRFGIPKAIDREKTRPREEASIGNDGSGGTTISHYTLESLLPRRRPAEPLNRNGDRAANDGRRSIARLTDDGGPRHLIRRPRVKRRRHRSFLLIAYYC